MNFKRFAIISCVIISIILVSIITLSFVKIDNGLKIDEPSMIKLYNTKNTFTYTKDTPANYEKAKKEIEESMRLSILDYMVRGISLDHEPSQDTDTKYETWKTTNTSNHYCVELIFDEKQSIIVNVNGNTKVVEFTGLIMKVEKSSFGKETALYISTSTSSSKNYSTNPILISAKQNKLYNFIASL